MVAFAVSLPAAAEATLSLWGQSATGELVGSRTSSAGIQATDGWANGNFALSWNISYNQSTGLWTYVYSANAVRKDISHFILEVSNDSRPVNTYTGTDTQISGPQTWTASSNGNSNPNMPNPIYGVKFNFGGSAATYTIVTDRAPVYGVFYAKDGKDGGLPVTAWSNALNYADYMTNTSLAATDFIVRPDSVTTVPLPAAALLFGPGLAGLIGIRRRLGR
jgi:hypothetical protein